MAKKIVYETSAGTIAIVHIIEGAAVQASEEAEPVALTLADHIAISVPVKLLKDGIVAVGVSEPYNAKAGEYLDARTAAANPNLSYEQVPYKVVDEADIPTDRLFRNAWRTTDDAPVVEDTEASKQIAHELRRQARELEFAPLDKVVMAGGFGDEAKLAEAEAERQAVRDKYATIQDDLDACDCPEDLRTKLAEAEIIPA